MKTFVSKEKFRCRRSRGLCRNVIFELCDRIPTYLRENEKVCETVFACSYGTQIESLSKKIVENIVTISLKCII